MRNPFTIKILFGNLGLKILGVAMALLLWFHVATNRQYDTTIDYTLEYINLPDSLVLSGRPQASVHVVAQGSGKSLLRFRWLDRRWPIDLSEARIGTFTIPLDVSHAPLLGLDGVQIIGLLGDSSLTLIVDSLAVKVAPIVSDALWQTAPGFVRVGEEQWTPATVAVTGPKEVLKSISEVHSAHLETFDLSEPFDREVGLVVPPGYGLAMSPNLARLRQAVEPYVTRQFNELAIRVTAKSSPDSYSSVPLTAAVQLGGPRSIMGQVLPDSISVMCVIADEDTSGARRPLWVYAPEPLQVLRTTPDSVTIRRNVRARTSTRN